jgi:hypothetical protein
MLKMYSTAAPAIAPTANKAMRIGKLHMLFSGMGVGAAVGSGVGIGVGVGVATGALITVKVPVSPAGLNLMVVSFPDTPMLSLWSW